jgi:hypothetical protein
MTAFTDRDPDTARAPACEALPEWRTASTREVGVRALLLIPSAVKPGPRQHQRGRTDHSPLHRAYRRRARRDDRVARGGRADQLLREGGRVQVDFPLLTRADAA